MFIDLYSIPGVSRASWIAMEPDSAGKMRFIDLPFVRMALEKWHELYGAPSEVVINILTVILVSLEQKTQNCLGGGICQLSGPSAVDEGQ